MSKKLIRLFLIQPVLITRKIYFSSINYLVLKINLVNYNSFPIINGKLIVVNRGKCFFGEKLKFNSSLYSNFVGLYKPCTIEIAKDATLTIGDFSGFSGVSIYCAENITIGKYLFCGGNVSIWDTDFHSLDCEERRNGSNGIKSAPVIIGDDVFIGANSIILKGVAIGNRVVIGAGSVVTKDISDDEIWAGNPAKKISKKFNI